MKNQKELFYEDVEKLVNVLKNSHFSIKEINYSEQFDDLQIQNNGRVIFSQGPFGKESVIHQDFLEKLVKSCCRNETLEKENAKLTYILQFIIKALYMNDAGDIYFNNNMTYSLYRILRDFGYLDNWRG